ncbi:MAG TPA: NTP transferase domain-containing protein [Phycisphaerales bacterium]|nr:NTP transferase domain-containing protein [Phycisphaerales bacterium]
MNNASNSESKSEPEQKSSGAVARRLGAVILAAGKGTRMNSDLPKVLHPVADRPMVDWVVDACEAIGVSRTAVIVGHQADQVRKALGNRRQISFVEQNPQLGTGHAVQQAKPVFQHDARDFDVLVLCGDGPLIRKDTLRQLLETHRKTGAAATLATSVIPNPQGYGRIVRDAEGKFERIVEHKDATEAQRTIHEVNPSYYCFKAAPLFELVEKLTNNNAKGEYYLTDVLTLMRNKGLKVEVVDAVPAEDVLSINTTQELAEVDGILRTRLRKPAGVMG